MKITKTVDKDAIIRYINENGLLHREDGPAYEQLNGYKTWYINGERHREDGPAIEYSDGTIQYFLNGKEYTKDDYELEILKIRLERIKNL